MLLSITGGSKKTGDTKMKRLMLVVWMLALLSGCASEKITSPFTMSAEESIRDVTIVSGPTKMGKHGPHMAYLVQDVENKSQYSVITTSHDQLPQGAHARAIAMVARAREDSEPHVYRWLELQPLVPMADEKTVIPTKSPLQVYGQGTMATLTCDTMQIGQHLHYGTARDDGDPRLYNIFSAEPHFKSERVKVLELTPSAQDPAKRGTVYWIED